MRQVKGHVLVADCPWRFGDSLPGKGRGAAKHYDTLSVEELKSFPLPPLHDDCYLFLWRVSSMQQEALDVAKAWGFTIKSEIVWKKLTKNGKTHFGMGRTVRLSHEVCLIGVRGRPEPKVKNIRSILEAEDLTDYPPDQVFEAQVGPHSRKPDEFYRLVETLCWGPYKELFARRQQGPEWECFGLEVNKEV